MKSLFKLLLISLLILNSGCGGGGTDGGGGTNPTPDPSVGDLIKKVWTVSSASWDGTVQFESSASSNIISGYSAFKLDLSTAGSVKLTEFDGNLFSGSYSINTEGSQLELTNLSSTNGAPSGTEGKVVFKILAKPTSTSMTIETSANYIKASNKIVKLVLKAS